jgi:hypothetical protein
MNQPAATGAFVVSALAITLRNPSGDPARPAANN